MGEEDALSSVGDDMATAPPATSSGECFRFRLDPPRSLALLSRASTSTAVKSLDVPETVPI